MAKDIRHNEEEPVPRTGIPDGAQEVSSRPLTPAARRALAEAEARRQAAKLISPVAPEFNGPAGPEPTRFGDWERKGIISDF